MYDHLYNGIMMMMVMVMVIIISSSSITNYSYFFICGDKNDAL